MNQIKKNRATIIMPVYNGEKFLKRSFNSIFQQKYSDIEVIAVDDGSTDNSSVVLKELQEERPSNVSIQIISEENKGICYARNIALEKATGEYIFFIDQDDEMEFDAVQSLIKELMKDEADILIGGFYLINEQGKIKETWRLNSREDYSPFRITAPWGRVFKNTIIQSNNIRFFDTKISEDFYFNICYMSYCKKISVTSYIGYRWFYRKKSESHSNMKKLSDERNPLPMLSQLLHDMKNNSCISNDLLTFMLYKHVLWYLLYVSKGIGKEKVNYLYNRCFEWLEHHRPEYRNINRRLSFPKGESGKIRLIVHVSLALRKAHLLLPFIKLYSCV
jgi:glycosyltransferase involved in cell wall biosynthesis